MRHRVFGIVWDRSGQCNKQIFVVIRADVDGRKVLLVRMGFSSITTQLYMFQ